MLNQMSFKRRILLLLATAVVGVAAQVIINVVQSYEDTLASRRELLKTAVQSVANQVIALQQQAASGKLTVEAAQAAAKDAVRGARYGGKDGRTEYFYAWTLETVGVIHPVKPEWTGQTMGDKIVDGKGRKTVKDMAAALKASPNGQAFVDTNFPRPGGKEAVPKLQFLMEVPGWGWMIGSGLYMDDINELVWRAAMQEVAVGVVVLLVIGVLGLAIARSVLGQLGGEPRVVIDAMQAVSRGDLGQHLRAAHGDSLIGQMQSMVDSLRTTIGQVRESIESITTAAGEIAQGNHDLSGRTEQAASSLQETASSMEEMSGAVGQSADTASWLACLAVSAL